MNRIIRNVITESAQDEFSLRDFGNRVTDTARNLKNVAGDAYGKIRQTVGNAVNDYKTLRDQDNDIRSYNKTQGDYNELINKRDHIRWQIGELEKEYENVCAQISGMGSSFNALKNQMGADRYGFAKRAGKAGKNAWQMRRQA